MIVRDTSGGGLAAHYAFGELADQLNRVPIELKRKMTPALRSAAQPIFVQAKKNASWSRRIPSAMSISVRYTGQKAGVRISVNVRKAPHARAYEGISSRASGARSGSFRHPVFAKGTNRRTMTWVSTKQRPFLLPALNANREAVGTQLSTTVNDVLRQAGF